MKKPNSSTLRYTGISSADVMWFVMSDQALHICQSHFATRQSRWYSSAYVSVGDTARLFVPERELLHTYDWGCGAQENLGHIFVTDPLLHICQSHLAIKTYYAILGTWVRIWDMGSLIHSKDAAFAAISLKIYRTSDPHPRESEGETRLRYSWLKCSFRCQGFPGLYLKIMPNWDHQSCPEWASWICMKPTVTICKSLWMLSLQHRYASRATT